MKGLSVLLTGLMLSGCATMFAGSPKATAELKNVKGESVGTASFWESADGVRIVAKVYGIPPGNHGFHIHTVGKCTPPDFMSAAAHFNPGGKQHGLKNPAGPHAGDLPNLEVEADGTGQLEYVTKMVTLGTGPTSLLGTAGRALVIHIDPDDETTDPTGNSGGRIACGVITKATASGGTLKSGY